MANLISQILLALRAARLHSSVPPFHHLSTLQNLPTRLGVFLRALFLACACSRLRYLRRSGAAGWNDGTSSHEYCRSSRSRTSLTQRASKASNHEQNGNLNGYRPLQDRLQRRRRRPCTWMYEVRRREFRAPTPGAALALPLGYLTSRVDLSCSRANCGLSYRVAGYRANTPRLGPSLPTNPAGPA
ncbi:hypothetical protein G7046_g3845 [Stylonectria norvegica]|nr:hypothetical protein G7046_g3845 [Stylonectria norvegica]